MRVYGNLIAVLIVFLVLSLMLLLSGCMTKYTIEKKMPDGTLVKVDVESFREFEQPQVHYSRNGDGVTFDFGAESATTATSPIEEAVGDVLRAGGTIATSGLAKPDDGQ